MNGPEELLLELFAIFVAAKVMGEILERLSLPAVLGEILAGAALGPYALGWIQPSDTIQSVAEIGAIFVLFSAGLETSPKDLIHVGRKALLVAGFIYMKLRGDATTEAIFVGAAMVATSVGITARVPGDLHVLATRPPRSSWAQPFLMTFSAWCCWPSWSALPPPVDCPGFTWGSHRGSGGVRPVHDFRRSPDRSPRSPENGAPFYPECLARRFSGHLPAPVLVGREDRNGGDHRRFLCRPDVRRLCSALEPAAARGRNHRVPCSRSE